MERHHPSGDEQLDGQSDRERVQVQNRGESRTPTLVTRREEELAVSHVGSIGDLAESQEGERTHTEGYEQEAPAPAEQD